MHGIHAFQRWRSLSLSLSSDTYISNIQIFKNAADKWRMENQLQTRFTFFKPHLAYGNNRNFSHSKLIRLSFCHGLILNVLLCADGYFSLVFLFSRYRHSFMILIYSHLSIYHCQKYKVTKSRKETLPFISQCQLYRPKLDWSTEFEIWNIACLHHCWYCLPGSPALFPRLQSILHYSTFFTSMYMNLHCVVHSSSL